MSETSGNKKSLKELNILCSICARGGSKGVPNKNLRLLKGKPLIAHSIAAARETGMFDAIAVSSDSEEILKAAKEWGADYIIKRPDELATDSAAKVPSIQHCMLESEKLAGKTYDVVCDLDATAPLRNADDIRGSVQLLLDNDCTNVLSGMIARRSPYYNLLELNDEGYTVFSKSLPKTVIRRQDAPPCFDANSSIYVWYRDSLLESPFVVREKTMMYVMPEERSLDIDSELDFKIVQYLMEHHVADVNAAGTDNPA